VAIRPILRAIAASTLVAATTLAVAAPAHAARVDLPDIVVTVAWDKQVYVASQHASVIITVRNAGAVDATDVHRTSGGVPSGVSFSSTLQDHFALPAGQQRIFGLFGTITADGASSGLISFGIAYEAGNGEAHPDDNSATATAPVADPDDVPDIAFVASFQPTVISGSDTATLTFAFTNHGQVDATDVHATGGESFGLALSGTFPNHVDVPAGQTVTRTMTAAAEAEGTSRGFGGVSFAFEAANGEADEADNISAARIRVLGATGSFSGVVFDEAGGVPPAAHLGLGCVTVALFNEFTPSVEEAHTTTDASGAFTFAGIPAGRYSLQVSVPTGYDLDEAHSVLDTFVGPGIQTPPTLIRVVRTADPVGPCPPPAPPANAPAAPADLAATGSPALRIAAAGLAAALIGIVLMLLVRRRGAPQ